MKHPVYPLWSVLLVLFFSGSVFAAGPPAEKAFPGRLSFSVPWDQETGPREEPPAERSGPDRHLGRAILEYFAVLAYSQTKYWLTYGDWIEDWHYKLTWEDQKKRFFGFRAWKFDSNNFNLNWSHALSGALYYNIARTNHLSVPESWLFTTAGSLYWEYIAEWRNVISINDNVFSALGGVPIGEAWFQLGRFFNSSRGRFHRILGFVNPLQKLNDWFDRNQPSLPGGRDDPLPHDFSLFLGGRNSRLPREKNEAVCFYAGLHTRIWDLPGYGLPGEAEQWIAKTLFSEMYFDITQGSHGTEEVNFFSRAVYLGLFRKNIDVNRRGVQSFLGLGSAFSYFRQRSVAEYDSDKVKVRRGYDLHLEDPRDFRDKFSVVHVAGPFFELRRYGGPFEFRLTLDAYLDFALVNAFAFNKYSETHDISGVKTTLLYYGYYAAFGGSLFSDLRVDYRNLRLEARFRCHAFDSVDGRDRFQDELTDDFSIRDSRMDYRLSAAFKLPGTPAELWFSREWIDRRGRIRQVVVRERTPRVFFGLRFRF